VRGRQLTTWHGEDQNAWSYTSTLHTPSLRGALLRTDTIRVIFTSCWPGVSDCSHTAHSAVTRDRQTDTDTVSRRGGSEHFYSTDCGIKYFCSQNAIPCNRLSTDIDFSKLPLTRIDITEQGRSFFLAGVRQMHLITDINGMVGTETALKSW
jgi:hypothetical protein